ncbi:unnamed protein product [Rhizophagus irregularis]|nr:unnamed protein product [Rhizophagus irregularis]
MVLWFLRFLLKEHRSEWAGIYERSEQYITKELGSDLEVEQIAIAGGRKAVRERFEIKDDLIVHSKTIVIARRLLLSYQRIGDKQTEEELLETARNFVRKRFDVDDEVLKVDETFKSTLALNIPLNIKKEIEDEIKSENEFLMLLVRTRTISETTEPKWEEVHYISIHGTGENITFEIMDKNLSVADKPSCEPIRELFSLVIGRKPSGGELCLEVQFVSTQYNWEESFVFKKETLTIEHIYIILSWKNTRSYFEFSDDIAHFFNYKSQEELKTWKNISADSEEWLGSGIDNIELEDKLYEICENFIIKRFNIKDLDEEQKNILISVKTNGAIPLDKTAELLGLENTEDLKKELQTYFKSESVKKVEHLWACACIIWCLHEVEDSKYITQTYNFSLND